MIRILIFQALLLALLVPSPAWSRISADEFIPPVQADTPQQAVAMAVVQNPGAVHKDNAGIDGKPQISAASAQDAINAFDEEGEACCQLKFPSGMGFASKGMATYRYMQNPTATLIAQRNAYVKAYTQAKKELAGMLHGFTSAGKTQLVEQIKSLSTSKQDLSNTSSSLEESTTEAVNGMIRGYVVYNVRDKQESGYGTVSVTIVTTPKTMGDFKRPDLNSISADSVRDGLNHVFVELENGLVPPVGGKIINVPQTGEIAYVAFGSVVVRSNPDKVVQEKLAINSRKIAQMRARNALIGILKGDDITSLAMESESTSEMSKQYNEATKDDPIAQRDEASYEKLQQQEKKFKNTQTFTEAITSVRAGVVPAGVSVKTFMNKDKTMVTGYAVYIPSATRKAESAAERMKALSPMSGSQGGQGGMVDFNTRDGNAPVQGPTGKVSNDSDL